MKLNRVVTIALVLGILGGQTLWAGWMLSGGLHERDARRLEAARKNHVSDVERAFNVYTTQVERANTTLSRHYEQVIRQYENRGDRDTAEMLKKELEELTANALTMPCPKVEQEADEDDKEKKNEPKNPHAQLIEWIGPQVINSRGDLAQTAGLAEYDYVMLYFTAGWCVPCRIFTPQVIEFYNSNRRVGKWEIVTVSGDQTILDYYEYLRESNMPWGAVQFERLEPSGLLKYQPPNVERFSGIWPRIVIFDRQGNAVLHATGASTAILNDFRNLLQQRPSN